MQTFIQTDRQRVQPHTLGVRVMLLSDRAEGRTGQRLADYGSVVDVADGLDDHEIAQYLGIAYGTVRAHVEKARLKVFARNRLMLAVLFLKGEIRVRDAA